jgi:glycosyltransferase involved in cell wall biosynthesis
MNCLRYYDIILLSTADWDSPFWTNKQHVAVQLTKRGNRVFYIDSLGLRRPSATSQDINKIYKKVKKAFQKPRQVKENLWVWSPIILPFQSKDFIRKFNFYVLNKWLDFWLKKLNFKKDILWTYNPLTVQLIGINSYKRLVYHCVDEIKAQPGMPSDILTKYEHELVKKSDIVFVTSPKLYETRKQWNQNTYYFPNVADYDHFSKALNPETSIPEDLLKIPKPRIGFIGALSSYKIDFKLLNYIAKNRPNWSIVLIGKIGEGDPWTNPKLLYECSNIYLLGPREYKVLPNYLKGFDVCILPNTLNEYTESMFPMKFFEYLSAGKPVVSVDLPAIKEFSDMVYIAKSYDDFIQKIEYAFYENEDIKIKRLEKAKKYTYESRTNKMMELIERIDK